MAAPALRTAELDGASIALTFDLELDAGSPPSAGDFAVVVDAVARTVTDVALAGAVVTLTLETALDAAARGTVAYAPGASPLQEAGTGDRVAAFNAPLTNVTAVDWPAFVMTLATPELGQDRDVARDEFDDGFVAQERRYTSALRTRRVECWLGSDAALVTFRAWVAARAHTWFTWRDPDDGMARRVRVRGGAGAIRYEGRIDPGGQRTWDFSVELEGLA